MKKFYFTEILTKQYYAVWRIRVVCSCELLLPVLDYTEPPEKWWFKKPNKLLKHILHKHKSQWTFASKWQIQFDYTMLYCVQLALLWFYINISLSHHVWIWVLLIWGLLHSFKNIQRFPELFMELRFIITFRKACQWQLPWVQFIKIHTLTLNFSKINYHVTLPSMAWSLKLFLSLRFSDNM